jgi:hypothetical protein
LRQREEKANTVITRLLDTEQLRAYVSLGRNSAILFGKKAGAEVKIGRRTLWDIHKIDAFLDSLTEE